MSDWPECVNPYYWSNGHIEDVTFEDEDIQHGNELTISSIIGTAHPGNWGDQATSDARMGHYDLLFFKARMNRREYRDYDHQFNSPIFGYRVSGKAVGWDTSEPMPSSTIVDDGTPGELLLPGKPITLPWGAYWCVLSTLPIDPPPGAQICNTISNNSLWLAVVPLVGQVVDGVKFPFLLHPPDWIDGMNLTGLPIRRILNTHAVGFRVNRRDWAG